MAKSKQENSSKDGKEQSEMTQHSDLEVFSAFIGILNFLVYCRAGCALKNGKLQKSTQLRTQILIFVVRN